MPSQGPHTRNAMPGAVFRGSKKRVARISPFEQLPLNFWLVLAIALLMLALCAVLIVRA